MKYYRLKKKWLLTLFDQDIQNHGLDNGKGGSVIISCFLDEIYPELKLLNYAEKQLDKLPSCLTKNQAGLINGVTGIGCLYIFLIRNRYFEGDLESLLGDVDNLIFKNVTEKNVQLSFKYGLKGYFIYLIMRYESSKDAEMKCLIERQLVEIVNKIAESLVIQVNHFKMNSPFNLFWELPTLLFCLSSLLKHKIYLSKVNRLLDELLSLIREFIPSQNIKKLYLYLAISTLNDELNSADWSDYGNVLSELIVFDKILDEFL